MLARRKTLQRLHSMTVGQALALAADICDEPWARRDCAEADAGNVDRLGIYALNHEGRPWPVLILRVARPGGRREARVWLLGLTADESGWLRARTWALAEPAWDPWPIVHHSASTA